MSTTPAPAASPAVIDPRFPIGKFRRAEANLTDHAAHLAVLAALPENLRAAIEGLSTAQLDTPYRDGGWTVRQLVHHVADSHMNACIRIRLALTEDWPTIKPYNEAAWAELHDSVAPVEWSLELIESLHARWVMLLQSLTEAQWKRGFVHPEIGRLTVEESVVMYGWHSRHHLAHITHLRSREKW